MARRRRAPMTAALLSFLLVLGASLVVGQALAAVAAGARRDAPVAPTWAAPALGLAALLVVAGVAIRLPGHGVTAAVALALVVIAAAAYLPGRVRGVGATLPLVAPVVLVTTVAAALPFAIAGHLGPLGAGLVNDDMASHLIIADYVADPAGVVPSFIKGGYPIGPHAIAAAIAEPTGADLVDVFAGFTVALAPLLGIAALGLLEGLAPVRRVIAACAVALAYLSLAYLLQGAFKEPMMSLLLAGMVMVLAGLVGLEGEGEGEVKRRPDGGGRTTAAGRLAALLRVLPLGVLVAGILFVYSLPGLLWVAAVGGAVVLARLLFVRPRPSLPDDWVRRFWPYAAGVLVVLLIATAQEWSRLADFSRVSALNPDRFGSQLGNLRGSLSPLEVLGVWPAGDFRTAARDVSGPTAALYLGSLVALAAVAFGLVSALRTKRVAVAAAAVAAIAAWGFLAVAGSPYVAAKGLAIAAPFVMAVAMRGTLGSRSWPAVALGAVLLAGAALSSFLVVRQAPVGPSGHAEDLSSIRDAVQDEDVLFLGRDDFIGWELRGSGEITGVVTNFYDVEDLRPRFKKGEGGGEKFDVDAVFPKDLHEFDYVLATTGGPASSVPPSYEEAARTDAYVLYRNAGSIGKRKTLEEGTEPGRVLDCETGAGRELSRSGGEAVIWDPPPVINGPEAWSTDEPSDGSPATQELKLPAAGRWLISLEYDSRRPLRVIAPDLGLEAAMDANLDFRGETPTFPVGEVEAEGPTTVEVTAEPEEPNLLARLLRAPNEAHLRSLTATPLDPGAIRTVPLREACGEYVDWFRPG